MNVEVFYETHLSEGIVNKEHAFHAKLVMHNVPEDYDEEDLKEWLRKQIAAMCSILFEVGMTRRTLLDLNRRYRESIVEIVFQDVDELGDRDEVYYAKFENPEKWYLLWMRKYKSGWAVHAQYMRKSVAMLVEGAPFWLEKWGSTTHDGYKDIADGIAEFKRIHSLRIAHGYTMTDAGHVVSTPDGSASYSVMEELAP